MVKRSSGFFNKFKINESTMSTLLGAAVVILVGFLIFNYFRQTSKKSEITPEAAQEKSEITFEEEGDQVVPVNLPVTHKVSSGEDLWKIAEKYYGSGYNWVDIAQQNKLINPDVIFIDQELNIPKVAVRKPLLEADQTKAVTDKIEGNTYKVKEGDNLWTISVRAYADGYKWPEIAKANNLANPDLLLIDQELKLPR